MDRRVRFLVPEVEAVRVLFDVTHPALVHLFGPAAGELDQRGHDVTIAARDKDVTTDLLDAAGVPYTVASRAGSGPLSRVGELIEREIGLFRLARRVDPDVIVSQVDPRRFTPPVSSMLARWCSTTASTNGSLRASLTGSPT